MSLFEVCCKSCGSVSVRVEPIQMVNGKFGVRGRCKDCGANDNIAQNEGPEEFVMPFGKYKGSTISEIVAIDRAYADWVVLQSGIKGNIRDKFVEAIG